MDPERSILIVDDSEEIRHALRLLFEVEDFHIVGEATNGSEAVWMAAEHQPRFVILDYRMPGLSGEETAFILRDVAPRARIIAFSAWLRGKPDWADAYLNKDRISDISPLLAGFLSDPNPATERAG